MDNLKIKPIKTEQVEDPRWDSLDERLPKPPFLMVLQAPIASGKTTMLVNLLYNPAFYEDKFDSIVIASPTIHNDLNWNAALKDDRNTILTGDDLDKLDDLIGRIYDLQLNRVQEALEEEVHPPHMLLVLDDCLGLLGKKFASTCTRLRHPRLSVIVSTQNFRSLPVQCRENAQHYVVFSTSNDKELAKITEEFSGVYGEQKFMECYREATKEKYNFLVMHRMRKQLYKNFDTLLFDANEK